MEQETPKLAEVKKYRTGLPNVSKILAEQTRNYIAERIEQEKDAIVTAQIKKAKDGDTTAFTALMTQGFGPPKQSIEVNDDRIIDLEASPEELALAKQILEGRKQRKTDIIESDGALPEPVHRETPDEERVGVTD